MTGEMYADAELLDDILNQAPPARCGTPVTPKALSYWTGLSVKTISDYRRGKLTIPVRFWRVVLRHLRDGRIVGLLLGETPHAVTWLDELPDLANDQAQLAAAVDCLGRFHALQQCYAELIRDGRIDEADAPGVSEFNRLCPAVVCHTQALQMSVNREFHNAARRAAS